MNIDLVRGLSATANPNACGCATTTRRARGDGATACPATKKTTQPTAGRHCLILLPAPVAVEGRDHAEAVPCRTHAARCRNRGTAGKHTHHFNWTAVFPALVWKPPFPWPFQPAPFT